MGLRFTGERIIPEMPELRVTFLQSLAAYEHAAPLADGARVLDCGSGEGYGTALLAERARLAVGIDRDPVVVAHAGTRYAQARQATFIVADVAALPFLDASFDLIVCFQVIEHLPNAEAFLREVRRVLAPGGTFMLTTPNVLVTGARPNPHHIHDFSPTDLRHLLERVFDDVELRGVFAGEQVAAYRASNDRIVRTIMRLDPLGLHRRIPTRVVEFVHIRVTRLVRRRVNTDNPDLVSNLTTADFPIATTEIEKAIDLLGVSR